MKEIQTPAKLRALEDAICAYAGIAYGDLYSGARDRELLDAKQVVWAVAHEYQGYTFKILACIYGTHYTTVRHGVNRMRKLPGYRTVVRELKKSHTALVDGTYCSIGSVGSWDFKDGEKQWKSEGKHQQVPSGKRVHK